MKHKKKIEVRMVDGGVGEEGDKSTFLWAEGYQLGYLFDDTAKRLGLPTVGNKKKRVTATVTFEWES